MKTITKDISLQVPVSQYDQLNSKIEYVQNLTNEKIATIEKKTETLEKKNAIELKIIKSLQWFIVSLLLLAIPSAIGAFFYMQNEIKNVEIGLQNEIKNVEIRLQKEIYEVKSEMQTISNTLQQVLDKLP